MPSTENELEKLFGKNYHLNGLSDSEISERYEMHKAQFYQKGECLQKEIRKVRERYKNGDKDLDLELMLFKIEGRLESLIREAESTMYYVKRL